MSLTQAQNQPDPSAADLLARESAILLIKSIEMRHGLRSCVMNKQERRLLDVLRQRPDLIEALLAQSQGQAGARP